MNSRRGWALAALVLSVLTIGCDTTILNVALPTLGGAIHATNSQLQWIVDAYVLVFAGLLLPAGALGDRYGRKLLLMTGLALFGGASVLGAFVDSPGQLIAIRAAMGIGAAILTPITLAVLPVLFSPARSEEHTSELQSRPHLVCRLLLEKKKTTNNWLEPNASRND